ncbi:hypothetical protein HDU92_000847 [Lobulomyces angularis]|nr:hypothetical protein HDU92_000847 [Lobulomyces angularis]
MSNNSFDTDDIDDLLNSFDSDKSDAKKSSSKTKKKENSNSKLDEEAITNKDIDLNEDSSSWNSNNLETSNKKQNLFLDSNTDKSKIKSPMLQAKITLTDDSNSVPDLPIEKENVFMEEQNKSSNNKKKLPWEINIDDDEENNEENNLESKYSSTSKIPKKLPWGELLEGKTEEEIDLTKEGRFNTTSRLPPQKNKLPWDINLEDNSVSIAKPANEVNHSGTELGKTRETSPSIKPFSKSTVDEFGNDDILSSLGFNENVKKVKASAADSVKPINAIRSDYASPIPNNLLTQQDVKKKEEEDILPDFLKDTSNNQGRRRRPPTNSGTDYNLSKEKKNLFDFEIDVGNNKIQTLFTQELPFLDANPISKLPFFLDKSDKDTLIKDKVEKDNNSFTANNEISAKKKLPFEKSTSEKSFEHNVEDKVSKVEKQFSGVPVENHLSDVESNLTKKKTKNVVSKKKEKSKLAVKVEQHSSSQSSSLLSNSRSDSSESSLISANNSISDANEKNEVDEKSLLSSALSEEDAEKKIEINNVSNKKTAKIRKSTKTSSISLSSSSESSIVSFQADKSSENSEPISLSQDSEKSDDTGLQFIKKLANINKNLKEEEKVNEKEKLKKIPILKEVEKIKTLSDKKNEEREKKIGKKKNSALENIKSSSSSVSSKKESSSISKGKKSSNGKIAKNLDEIDDKDLQKKIKSRLKNINESSIELTTGDEKFESYLHKKPHNTESLHQTFECQSCILKKNDTQNELQLLQKKIKELSLEKVQILNKKNLELEEMKIKLTKENLENLEKVKKLNLEEIQKLKNLNFEELKNLKTFYLEEVDKLNNLKGQEENLRFKALEDELKKSYEFEIDALKIKYIQTISQLKQVHVDELKKVIYNGEAAEKLFSLVGKVENSSNFVSNLQKKIENDHDYSIKERETAFQEREKHIANMQENALAQQIEIEKERDRVYQIMKKFEVNLMEVNNRREEERKKLVSDTVKFEKEKDEFNVEHNNEIRQLRMEKVDFIKSKEEWNTEKKKLMSQIFEEKKNLTTEKLVLDAKKEEILNLEAELNFKKNKEEEEIKIFKDLISKENTTLKEKRFELERNLSIFKFEKLKFEASKSKLDCEISIFDDEKENIEKIVKDSKNLYQETLKERKSAQLIKTEGEISAAALEQMKCDVENQRKRILDERIVAAQERGKYFFRVAEKKNHFIQNKEKQPKASKNSIYVKLNRSELEETKLNKSKSIKKISFFEESIDAKRKSVENTETSNNLNNQVIELDKKLNTYLLDLEKNEIVLEKQFSQLNNITNYGRGKKFHLTT